MSEIIITSKNWRDHTGDPALCGTQDRTSEPGSLGYAVAPTFQTFPRDEWKERIAEGEATQSFLNHILDAQGIPYKDQGMTNYCHAACTVHAVEAIRAFMGLPYVNLSIGSVGGPATGYVNPNPPRGKPAGAGAQLSDDLKIITQFGAASVDFVPNLQVARSGWKPGAAEDAAKHKVPEWYDFGWSDDYTTDRVMTLLMSRIPIPVGYGWWKHAVLLVAPAFKNGRFCFMARNSWKGYGQNGYFWLEADGQGRPQQAFAPRLAGVG